MTQQAEIGEIQRIYNIPSVQERLSHAEVLNTRLLLVIAKQNEALLSVLNADTLPQCFQNVNAYGENFAVAMQEGLVRGQRGISQY